MCEFNSLVRDMILKSLQKSVLLLGIFSSGLSAQLLVNQDTPANMINNVLVGTGVNVSNIVSQGQTNQFGTFNGTNSNLGLNYGIVLSTAALNPPNGLAYGSTLNPANPNMVLTPDPNLSALIGNSSLYNLASIQFDFIPLGDTLKFDYVFASDEYNDYVNSSFNDVFGFFLTGPNPAGGAYNNTNVAIIPGSGGLPVSINNVNNGYAAFGCASGPCSFCQYFFDNCNPTSVAFDGFTVGLRVAVPVIPCTTYTIRMAIADVGDNAFNSAVFLKAGSFSSGLVSISSEVDYGNSDTLLYEGCSNATISFYRSGNNIQSDTVFYSIGGTATPGADYPALPGFVVFPPGVDTVQINITPHMDMIQEGNETIIFTVQDTVCGQPFITSATLTIVDVQPLQVLTPDTFVCYGEVINLNYGTIGGSGNFTTNWTFNGNPVPAPYFVQPPTNRTYQVSVYDDCLDTTITANLTVKVFPKPNVTVADMDICSEDQKPIVPSQILPNMNYSWSPSDFLDDPEAALPVFSGSNNGSSLIQHWIYLELDSAGVVCTRDSALILIHPLPYPGLNGDTLALCEDAVLSLQATPGYSAYQWNNGPFAPEYEYSVNTPGWYYVNVIQIVNAAQNVKCEKFDSVYVEQQFKPVFSMENQIICPGDTAVLVAPDSLGSILWSTGETTAEIKVTTDTILTVTISNSCGGTTEIVEVTYRPEIPNIKIPNVFTPNGNGINDRYEIPELELAESFRWDIYTRWGTKVFTSTSLLESWDGTTSTGAPLPEGTYFVVINYIDCYGKETQRSGHLELLRN